MDAPPTLADMGVGKKTSALAQKLAGLSDTERNAVAARDKTLAAVTREKTAKVRAKRISLPDAKYRVIYADPPWKYNDKSDAAQEGVISKRGRTYKCSRVEHLRDLLGDGYRKISLLARRVAALSDAEQGV